MTTEIVATSLRRKVPFALAQISDEARQNANDVLSSGWLTTGTQALMFESEFSAHVGVSHTVAVSSCTAAIELSLRALRLRPGTPVLTPTMTFCGAVHAIVHAGLRPVFVDVDASTLVPRPDQVVAAAARQRPGAMVVQHMAGFPVPVDELACAAGLPMSRVVEDAAHALGARVGSQPIGAISAATCFSFYATKNLPIGEGGAITTDEPDIAAFVRSARLHGMSKDAWSRYLPGGSWQYTVDGDGIKANMSDLQAAIGRGQLLHLDEWQRRRAVTASQYDSRLAGFAAVELPARPPVGTHAWHLYVVRFAERVGVHRDEIIDALAAAGVGTSVHFIPAHRFPYFRRLLGDDACSVCPEADAVFARMLSLPMHQGLDTADVDYVCERLEAAVAQFA
jgi:dTDP-4-amino-4,6-dideoxygalactose transaminase